MRPRSSFPDNTETTVGNVLLIGVTGGTGANAVQVFFEQNAIDLRAKYDTVPVPGGRSLQVTLQRV
ncbi:hypothetical protein IQ268_24250 [Oculatella sp. LEGE 06141]|uniref:hypothetical protein n=1 Tax=Oculatella sp. LEGE 06141 TaxID=1828648 RepID=UPI0018800C52|nr:hypothetical protein [Oculatella sp. LEGE 06141]MBE9181681.1 hypothetical protein [Oculatella sp. LEGE 06141]